MIPTITSGTLHRCASRRAASTMPTLPATDGGDRRRDVGRIGGGRGQEPEQSLGEAEPEAHAVEPAREEPRRGQRDGERGQEVEDEEDDQGSTARARLAASAAASPA